MKRVYTFITIIFFLLWITGCTTEMDEQEEENVFPLTLLGSVFVNENEYKMKSGGFRWKRQIGSEIEVSQTDHASPYQMAEDIKAIPVDEKDTIYMKVEEEPHVTVYLWNEKGRGNKVTLTNNEFKAPTNKGKYVYEAFAEWADGEIPYTFVIEVK